MQRNDIVPRMPFSFIGRFWHVPESLHYLSVNDEFWINPSWLRVLIDRYHGTKRSIWTWATHSYVDHSIELYCDNLLERYHYLTGGHNA